MAVEPDEFIPTRASLLNRLKAWDDQESWKEFFDTYWKMLYSVAKRSGLNDSEAQDIVQEAILAVANKMPNFRYDPEIGSFKSWLMLIVRRRIIDFFRKVGRQPLRYQPNQESASQIGETGTMEQIPDPEGNQIDRIYEEEWEQQIFRAALERIKQRVDYEDYQVFDCYAIKGWPPEQVAQTLNVTMSFVYNAKYRLTKLLKEEVHRLEQKMM